MAILIKVAAVIVTCFLSNGNSVPQVSTQTLLDQISTDSNAIAAEQQLENMGAEDVTTRKILSDKLPLLLAPTKNDKATLLFVQLAGALKLVSTVPAMSELLTIRRYKAMASTLTERSNLIDDPVGAALANIGDPSVPQVSNLLQSSDQFTRQRAIHVLYKIRTPKAMNALRNAGYAQSAP